MPHEYVADYWDLARDRQLRFGVVFFPSPHGPSEQEGQQVKRHGGVCSWQIFQGLCDGCLCYEQNKRLYFSADRGIIRGEWWRGTGL